ncbi:MAG: NYN domain-containing protein [Chloroflexota bacterium]
MPYLIDGHNLIGQLPDISLHDPNDEVKLVNKLRSFCARTNKKVFVIFDRGIPGGKSKLSNSTVRVSFAARPGEADDIMLNRIHEAKDTHKWIVVSSDLRVLNAARQRGMKGLRSREFAKQLEAPPPPPRDEHPHPFITRKEVEEWLEIFEQGKPPTS